LGWLRFFTLPLDAQLIIIVTAKKATSITIYLFMSMSLFCANIKVTLLYQRNRTGIIAYICAKNQAMNEQESKTKKVVRDISNKIDELLEQSDISEEDVKKKIDARIKELKKSRDEVSEELKKIKEDNKESIEKMEKLAKNTAKELKSAVSGFLDKFSEKEAPKTEKKDKSKE
jgi:DNA anti-recombination protein RmuC